MRTANITEHPDPRHAPGISSAEVASLSAAVIKSHRPRAVALACLVQLTHSALSKSAADLSSLLALQRECVRSYMREHGIPKGEVGAALEALGRAGQTAEYIDSIPG